ncbi:AAA family ATPase [Paenibacillus sp. ACRRX]|uniref:AAA family ATPase n=1 Tax=Paenibacillus sp. ACRRX TaxID=2918206 RepID=UPI001EF44E46|nr:AAA family ATPase [Paenibacillus sp. ACRRX]MCG7408661.1 AAA family ATPase [Paenibacillus sp. ACRRX]
MEKTRIESAFSSVAYIKHVELRREAVPRFDLYPFCLDAVRTLDKLSFTKPVTFLVGENGSGKSTLLEGIAVAYGFNPEGGSRNMNFETKSSHSDLHHYLRIARGIKKANDGYFFRAESYYNVASQIDILDEDKEATGPPIKMSYGGKSLHEQSHGEAFFSTFMQRFGGHGIYLMDEPEAALSPIRQMSLLVRMHELVQKHSQFIIATHSPILMSYPGADIYMLDQAGIRETALEDTDHYVVTRSFMNDREAMLRQLLQEEE